jgi:hypothetical protein
MSRQFAKDKASLDNAFAPLKQAMNSTIGDTSWWNATMSNPDTYIFLLSSLLMVGAVVLSGGTAGTLPSTPSSCGERSPEWATEHRSSRRCACCGHERCALPLAVAGWPCSMPPPPPPRRPPLPRAVVVSLCGPPHRGRSRCPWAVRAVLSSRARPSLMRLGKLRYGKRRGRRRRRGGRQRKRASGHPRRL